MQAEVAASEQQPRNVTYRGISSAWRASFPWISQKEPFLFVCLPGVLRRWWWRRGGRARTDSEVPSGGSKQTQMSSCGRWCFIGDRAGRSRNATPANRDGLLALLQRVDAGMQLCVSSSLVQTRSSCAAYFTDSHIHLWWLHCSHVKHGTKGGQRDIKDTFKKGQRLCIFFH